MTSSTSVYHAVWNMRFAYLAGRRKVKDNASEVDRRSLFQQIKPGHFTSRQLHIITQSYLEQAKRWPPRGRYILAQFDDASVCVYQAYRPSIAQYAVEHQRFGGEFSYSRMSWIKPNFLWMMYRSGWASKEGQECILAVRLRRTFFDEILRLAVTSTYDSSRHPSQEQWRADVATSRVRLQWDPDHDPFGRSLERRAVQLGIRGEMLRRYGEDEILSIEDITPFVVSQRPNVTNGLEALVIPKESVYLPASEELAHIAGIDSECLR